jgi:lysophospholipase L1-like esterase
MRNRLVPVFLLLIAGLFTSAAKATTVAISSYTVYSNSSLPCLFMDDGNDGSSGGLLNVYQPYVANEPTQVYNWVENGSGNSWYIQNAKSGLYLYDNGSSISTRTTPGDTFYIANPNSGSTQGNIYDQTTKRYLGTPSDTDGTTIPTSSTAGLWYFSTNGSSTSTPGCSGGTTSSGTTFETIGDSINGVNLVPYYAGKANGYAYDGYGRCALYWTLEAYYSTNISFIGNGTLPDGVPQEQYCNASAFGGGGGQTTQQIQTTIDSDGDLTNGQPQYVIVMAGTNDNFNYNKSGYSEFQSNYTSLLTDILTKDPQLKLLVALTIPPVDLNAAGASSGESMYAPYVPNYNAIIESVVSSLQQKGYPVVLNDFYTACNDNISDCMGADDGVHPDTDGYATLGNTTYNVLAPYLGTKQESVKAAIADQVKTTAALAPMKAAAAETTATTVNR